MSVFNHDNTGHITGKYPLFLGDDLGLYDTVNTVYPQIEELYQLQVSQIWNEAEIDLTQDKIDMQSLPKETTELMVKTISWQHLADSIASKSIAGLLMPHCTNSELEGLINLWSFFETIHARTYSHIVKQTFTNPNQMLDETYADTQVLIRSHAIQNAFDELEALPKDASEEEKRKAIIKAFTALFALEAIAFMSSFAVTFGIAETGVFQGIAQLVKLIARDEMLHTRMDYAILDILIKEPEWADTIAEVKDDIREILDSVVNQELMWACYLFSDGRQVVGLNKNLLREYTLHMAQPLYDALGIEFKWEAPATNPLPYMDNWLDSTKVQTAAQELQLTAYKVGAVKDDTADMDLDFEL